MDHHYIASISLGLPGAFSAAIVNLSEELRYAQFIRALPGLWRKRKDLNLQCCSPV